MSDSIYKKHILIILGILMPIIAINSQRLQKLPSSINTEYEEITPVLSQDGERLYFTRIGYPEFNRTLIEHGEHITHMKTEIESDSILKEVYSEIAGRTISHPRSSVYNQDIWIAQMDTTGAVEKVWHPGFPLNNALPNSVLSTLNETNELVLLNQINSEGYMYKGISISKEKEGRNFTVPRPINVYNYGSDDGVISLSISERGDIIIWALDRREGYGGRDLYVSFKIGDYLYTTPKNLGPEINSSYRESAPFLSKDGKTIYFSTDRPSGRGGTDIYYAERLDYSWVRWSPIKGMESPVNSEYDDSQPVPSPDGKYLYFTSRRSGNSDIYRYRIKEIDTLNPALNINGLVVDAETGEAIAAEVSWGLSRKIQDGYPHYFRTSYGQFSARVKTVESYSFYAEKQGYQSNVVKFNPINLKDTTTTSVSLKIPLKKNNNRDEKLPKKPADIKKVREVEETIEKQDSFENYLIEKTYVMDRIYFVRSKAIVLKRSVPALNELYEMMRKDTSLVILISGHTDNRGPKKLLMNLSRDRANAIKAYLMKHGIKPSRIKTVGYGAQRPLNDNSTEAERRKNRRVEISFLKGN